MTPFHAMPGHLIRRLNQIAVSVFQEHMQALGLDLTPVQFAALQALGAHPGIDQATLSALIAYDRATIGGVVDRMEGKRLIARRINRRDRRARELRLTEAGAALLARAQPEVEALQKDILAGLDEGEQAQFLALAARLAQAGNARSRVPMAPAPDGGPDTVGARDEHGQCPIAGGSEAPARGGGRALPVPSGTGGN